MTEQIKFQLTEKQIPHTWYNLAADLQNLAPLKHPGTGESLGVEALLPIVPEQIAIQEMSTEREIEIPEQVRQIYAQWRPSPLFRARRLEQALGTPARIYYKYEGVSPAGSHKPNTAIAQAYYNKQAGITRMVTETGAGQWGSALSFAGAMFGLDVKVYMVKVSYHQKPYRKLLMQSYGATCVPSPSLETACGRKILAEDPDCPGSLGIATSEALEIAAGDPFTNYAGGSVLNHVLLHQTVIGQEALAQMALADDYPDVVIGCAGGGSNLAGLTFPFIGEKIRNGKQVRIIAAEPAACPTLTKGTVAYDFGDTAQLTPLLRMHTLGHSFIPPSFHAGGLRYHGIGPLVTAAMEEGHIEAQAIKQTDTFEAALTFARSEGLLPAPESAHAIRAAIEQALRCKEEGRSEAILFGLSGHGIFDLGAYDQYMSGALSDEDCDEAGIAAALAKVPGIAAAKPAKAKRARKALVPA